MRSVVAGRTLLDAAGGPQSVPHVPRLASDDMFTLRQAAIDGLDETDLTSQDVAIAIKAGLEKDRWFLSAHLAA